MVCEPAEAILGVVWTHLANWLVQDGEVPELSPGARLRHVALRAACWSIHDSQQGEGVRELGGVTTEDNPPAGYTVTGIVERADEPHSVLLRVGPIQLFAEPDAFRIVGDEGALEPYSPTFRIPEIGSRVSVECTLEVLAAYQALDLVWGLRYPDLRRDWEVDAIKVVQRAWEPTGMPRESKPGAVISVDDVNRMHAWNDERQDALCTYLLDLRPAGQRTWRL